MTPARYDVKTLSQSREDRSDGPSRNYPAYAVDQFATLPGWNLGVTKTWIEGKPATEVKTSEQATNKLPRDELIASLICRKYLLVIGCKFPDGGGMT